LFFITEVESVYCAVRTESLYKADYLSSLKGLNKHNGSSNDARTAALETWEKRRDMICGRKFVDGGI
jgi:hypothetical protein